MKKKFPNKTKGYTILDDLIYNLNLSYELRYVKDDKYFYTLETIGDVVKFKEEDFLQYGYSKQNVEELKDALSKIGLKLGEDRLKEIDFQNIKEKWLNENGLDKDLELLRELLLHSKWFYSKTIMADEDSNIYEEECIEDIKERCEILPDNMLLEDIKGLSLQEQQIINMFYGINEYKGKRHKKEDIAKEMGFEDGKLNPEVTDILSILRAKVKMRKAKKDFEIIKKIWREDFEEMSLEDLQDENLWLYRKLQSRGFNKVGDLVKMTFDELKKSFSVQTERVISGLKNLILIFEIEETKKKETELKR